MTSIPVNDLELGRVSLRSTPRPRSPRPDDNTRNSHSIVEMESNKNERNKPNLAISIHPPSAPINTRHTNNIRPTRNTAFVEDTILSKPPLASPETEDYEDNYKSSGVNDNLLESKDTDDKTNLNEAASKHELNDGKDIVERLDGSDGVGAGDQLDTEHDNVDGYYYYGGTVPTTPNGIDRPFPYSPDFIPGMARIVPDVNVYQQKKNLAQGMMDLALLSANANQLRYVIESKDSHPYYYPSVTFIGLSIIFQIAVGVGLIVNSRYNVKDEDDICKADKINNFTVLGIFLITIVNVFITSFGVATVTTVNNVT